MGPEAIIILQLIARYGVPAAESIFNIVATKFAENGKPDAAMWQALRDKENASHAAFAAALAPKS